MASKSCSVKGDSHGRLRVWQSCGVFCQNRWQYAQQLLQQQRCDDEHYPCNAPAAASQALPVVLPPPLHGGAAAARTHSSKVRAVGGTRRLVSKVLMQRVVAGDEGGSPASRQAGRSGSHTA
jgi:hypothetical protein